MAVHLNLLFAFALSSSGSNSAPASSGRVMLGMTFSLLPPHKLHPINLYAVIKIAGLNIPASTPKKNCWSPVL